MAKAPASPKDAYSDLEAQTAKPSSQSATANTEEIDSELGDALQGLDSLADLWETGKESTREDQPVGKFQAKIVSAQLTTAQSSGKPMITYQLQILTGPSKGKTIYKYDGLGSEKQIPIAQGSLRTLGIDVKGLKLQELPALLLSLHDSVVSITAKHNGEYYNIYFNKANARQETANILDDDE
jgi:hypothetical protein